MHSRASHFWPTHILCGFLDDSKSAFRAGHHRAACVCVVKYKNQFVCKQRDKYLIIFSRTEIPWSISFVFFGRLLHQQHANDAFNVVLAELCRLGLIRLNYHSKRN